MHIGYVRLVILAFLALYEGFFLGHPSQTLCIARASAPALNRGVLLLLACDRLGRPLAGARIGVRALAMDRQTLAVTQATVAAEVHQPFDIHGNFTAKIAFDDIIPEIGRAHV